MPTPDSLANSPNVSDWLDFTRDGYVGIKTGKVEFGQGILTALRQIVAEELNVPLEKCHLVAASTALSPNEGFTAGSLSVQDSGSALRLASATARVRAGSESYWSVAATLGWDIPIDVSVLVKSPDEYSLVGRSTQRIDLDRKVQGKPSFIHDLRFENLLFARVLRPPTLESSLVDLHENRVALGPEIEKIIIDGSFVAVIAHDEFSAQQVVAQLADVSRWAADSRGFSDSELVDFLANAPADSQVVHERGMVGPGGLPYKASYSRPYLSHGSIGTVTAVAQWVDDSLHVWSQTQGVYPLRADMARAFSIHIDRITVTHVEGAGCYGHNGADDVAFDAALVARHVPGRPILVSWSREDELSWAPFGPAMSVDLAAALNDSGLITHWSHTVRGNGHSTRPSTLPSPSLLAYAHLPGGIAIAPAGDPPMQRGGGTGRNSVPLYDFENCLVTTERLLDMPVRTSAMRALGAHMNVFAIESFLDELALGSDQDPVEFRLRHLSDPRGRDVISKVAEISGWGEKLPEGCGKGIGFARYKNKGAWCAVVAQVEAENHVKVTNLWIAVDVGLVINPDGVINQIEGGALQSTSWTTKEQVRISKGRVISNNWEDYSILKFSDVPLIQTEIISRPTLPTLGAGEASIGPTGAAIANALASAIEVRVRNMPLSPENIIASMDA
ncbi:MAG: molybdopterin-dependent oxidoreductase [Candidatus Nanopelagicaceae bacterium]|nr:molybdopterin-dependent oxidoreductase [Candidatus Nanopelagicaceae bacterium]